MALALPATRNCHETFKILLILDDDEYAWHHALHRIIDSSDRFPRFFLPCDGALRAYFYSVLLCAKRGSPIFWPDNVFRLDLNIVFFRFYNFCFVLMR